MRRQSIWLKLFALLALIPLVVPMSVQAALCRNHPAGMACCMAHAKPKPVVKATETPSCCAKRSEPTIASAKVVSMGSDEGCRCTIKSYPQLPSNDGAAVVSSPITPDDQVSALTVTASETFGEPNWILPSIFAGDSSPPIVGHFSASLGRAPPIG